MKIDGVKPPDMEFGRILCALADAIPYDKHMNMDSYMRAIHFGNNDTRIPERLRMTVCLSTFQCTVGTPKSILRPQLVIPLLIADSQKYFNTFSE
jgi:hypothetical protein